MDFPLVTIMIPAYNQETFIERAVNSALAQDYPNLDVIVSDDCSTDKTGQIASSFLTDLRFRYSKNELNLGRVKNYKRTLFTKTKGDWILNLDADDYLIDTNYISKAISLIKTDPEIVVVFSRLYFHYLANNQKDTSLFSKKTNTINDGIFFFLSILNPEAINHPTALYNKALAIKIDFYRMNNISCDWESLARIMLHGKVGFLNNFAAVWEIHGKNESMNLNLEGFIDHLTTYESIFNYAKNHSSISLLRLIKWKTRMIYSFSFLIIGRFFLDRNLRKAFAYLIQLIMDKPLIGTILIMDLRFYGMFIIGHSTIEKFVRKLYYKMKGCN
jgi:glycosyltransferase involved in cell wall biosynthesis